jgi:prepilin-type N-terminal cleavage/methylation domain-containing protein
MNRDSGRATLAIMAEGFSLIEVLIALFLSAIVFLMLAQMLGVGVEAGRAATDITSAAALAGDRLEELSQIEYSLLAPGGSIGADVGGFSDILDVDGDGINDYLRRWEIADLGSSKRIRVRVISLLEVIGPAKEATYVTLIAEK